MITLNKIKLFVVICMSLFLTSCVTMVTKGNKFPLMYEEKPLAIVVLPPINESTAADAKEYYSTTIQEPLSQTGYYVFPYEVTSEILKMEGIYDAELLTNMPLGKFREYFGADAVLFTRIQKWDLNYAVLVSTLEVSINAQLKSTKTDQVLWEYNGNIVVDLSGGNSGGGLAGLVVKVVVVALNSAMADYVVHARTANVKALGSIPLGKYHQQFNQDQDIEIIDQNPEEQKL